MTAKPTNEEVEKMVKKIGKESAGIKQVSGALRGSEEKHRILAEECPVSIMAFDREGRITFVNNWHLRTFVRNRYGHDFFMGKRITELPGLVRAGVAQELERIFKGETVILEDVFFPEFTGGHSGYQNIKGVPLYKEGEFTGGILIREDVTEQNRADEKLRELNRAVEQSFEGIGVADLEGRFAFVNPAWARMHGYQAADLIGKPVGMLDLPSNRERLPEIWEEIKKKGYWQGEFERLRKDGSSFPVIMTSSLVKDSKDKPVGIIGTCVDMSLRIEAEKRLRESEERYRALMENSSDAILILDRERKIVSFNQALLDLFGYDRDEVVGKSIRIIHQSDDSFHSFGRTVYPVIERVGTFRIEWDFMHRDGSIFPVETVTSAIKSPDGSIIGYVAVIRDISERRQAEEALRESEEKYRTVVERSLDGIVIIQDGSIKFANKPLEEMLKYTIEEAIETPFTNYLHPDEVPRLVDIYQRVMAGDDVMPRFESVLRTRDGSDINVEVSVATIHYQGQIAALVIVRDITEKLRLERERLRAEKLESVGILAGGIAHDFNNILTIIMGNVSLAKMDIDRDNEFYELLEEAEKASHRASDLTQQLLTFSKGGVPVKQTASLPVIIRESVGFSLRGSNVRCDFRIPDDIWPVEVDVGQVTQVINNMVINADQAMPEGGVVNIQADNIFMKPEHGLPLDPGKYVRLSVQDQGIGIPEKHLGRIFDPYFSTKQEGSGLGLATAYSIIKKHNGHITVNSEVGVGSLFHTYLPASEKQEIETEQVRGEPVRGEGRIMVMDDEEGLRNVARQMLTRLGYEVELTKDGDEALKIYEKAKKSQNPFDAVILDLTVPGGTGGKETIKRLKEIDPDVKAIVASGYSNDPVLGSFGDYGFRCAIPKPFKVETLSRALHDVLKGTDK